jgi:hypothetical protein
MIKRLFSATESPDLYPVFSEDLVKKETDGSYNVPITIENRSSAIAEHTKVSITIKNTSSCEKITVKSFQDQSSVNPGIKIYIRDATMVIHRGMSRVVGSLYVKMKKGKRPKRRLDISITLFANKMIAREIHYIVNLTNKKFTVRRISENTLY